jgi:hypothetical protein
VLVKEADLRGRQKEEKRGNQGNNMIYNADNEKEQNKRRESITSFV